MTDSPAGYSRLILSLSKDEASHHGAAASSFDKLRMRPAGIGAPRMRQN